VFDTIIRGGRVVDGTGAAERTADIGIHDGRIVAIESSLDGAVAGETIDASGRLVTPGFVDIHSHYDGQATWDEVLEPSSHHGVTTVIMGNCGVGFAPVRTPDRTALIELMEGVEDIPGAALAEGMTWGWESFPEYLDVLSKRQWSIDVGTQLAHGPLRSFAMGPEDAKGGAANADQISLMALVAQEAMEAGAFGFTTSRTFGHRAVDGTPVPGTFALLAELEAIAEGVRAGGGLNMEFAASGLAHNDPAGKVVDDFAWIGKLAAETGLSTTFILLQAHHDPERWRTEMEQARLWRASGASVTPLVAGRPFGVIWGWDVRHPFTARPTYRSIAHLPLAERLERLREPAVRQAILSEADQPADITEKRMLGYIARMLPNCHIMVGPADYEQPKDQTMGALAEARGVTPYEVAYDGMLQPGAMLLFALYNYASWDHAVLLEQLEDHDTVVGLADGGAHCAFICDASIPTFMLSHWTRDRHRGPRISVPEAVRRLSSQTADLYGLNDRGRLAPGLRADVNVIDYERLGINAPVAVHDLPMGGTRLLQAPAGYDMTMVAGAVTRRHGVDTGARPGRLLRN
jgi:N-acyl-D-amino-acid deacylase